MGYKSLEEDSNIPDGAIMIAEVTVTQYATEDGSLHFRTHYDGDLPLSSILGLLAMGGIHIYNSSNQGD